MLPPFVVDFNHENLTVAAGTTVTWRNQGVAIHTTTSDDDLWGSDVLRSGQTFSFTFSQPGTFDYFCAIHPDMTATITVTSLQATPPSPAAAAARTPTPKPTPTLGPEATPTPDPQAAPGPEAVDADIENFIHPDSTVGVGTTVVWTNLDRVQHTVTSARPSDTGPGSLFDSGADFADWVAEGNHTHSRSRRRGCSPTIAAYTVGR